MRTSASDRLIAALALAAFLLHLLTAAAAQFGYFRDELYYIACAQHLDYGYVDHPPLSIWLLAGWKGVAGESLFALRLLPAFLGGLTSLFVGKIARRLGGGVYAISLACVTAMVAPIFLAFFGLYTMNAIDLLLWSAVFLVFLDLLREDKPGSWLLLGTLLGLGAMNKLSMLWLAAGIAAGVLLSSRRSALKKKDPWLAFLIAALLFIPYAIWNLRHDFAHLEFMRNAAEMKYASQNPLTLLSGLMLLVNPIAVPVWLAGFWFLFRRRAFRAAGIAVATVLLILVLNIHSKSEYFAAAMTLLLPAGAVQIESALQKGWLRILRAAYLPLIAAGGVTLLPMTKDVLSIKDFETYQSALGLKPSSTEGQRMGSLPQHYADRFGWERLTEVVAGVHASLPMEEQRRTLIYGRNYGEAAAVDFFGKKYGLPPAISQHNSYWYWSREHLRQDATFIVIGVDSTRLAEDFEEVRPVALVHSDHVMPYENDLPISICRKLRRPAAEVWKEGKLYI